MASFPPEKAPKPGLNIYGCAAVNPTKLAIAAEELGYVATPPKGKEEGQAGKQKEEDTNKKNSIVAWRITTLRST